MAPAPCTIGDQTAEVRFGFVGREPFVNSFPLCAAVVGAVFWPARLAARRPGRCRSLARHGPTGSPCLAIPFPVEEGPNRCAFSRRGAHRIHRTAVMSVPFLLRLPMLAVSARAMRAVGPYDKAARLRNRAFDGGPKMSCRRPLCHRCNCNRKRQGGDRRFPTYAQHDTTPSYLRSLCENGPLGRSPHPSAVLWTATSTAALASHAAW